MSSGLLVGVTATAASANTDEAAFIRDTNAARAAHGLPALAVYSDLTTIARNWSANMAAKNTLYHNPNLASQVQNWKVVGENVGVGPDESSIQTAFMNSPEHRANILDSEYTQFGVGTVRDSKGQLWVTVDFRDPMYSSAPAPSRTVASRPAPSSSPTSTPSHPTAPAYTPSSGSTVSQSRPHPAASPTATLNARLAAARAAVAKTPAADPVAQALGYVSVMATLTH